MESFISIQNFLDSILFTISSDPRQIHGLNFNRTHSIVLFVVALTLQASYNFLVALLFRKSVHGGSKSDKGNFITDVKRVNLLVWVRLEQGIVEDFNDLSRGMEQRAFNISLWQENISYTKLAVHFGYFQDQISISLHVILIKWFM